MTESYEDRWRELAAEAWGPGEELLVTGYAITEAVNALCDYVAEGGIGHEALEHLEAAEECLKSVWPS
jgi:hypothetical protein